MERRPARRPKTLMDQEGGAPYQWRRRNERGFSWYYGWDCASGCIWRASAIREIRLIEIDMDVGKTGEEEAA